MGIAWTQGIEERSPGAVWRMRVRATWGGFRERRLFADVRTYVGFLGYARSGHTLLAALLDAHPDAVIANELDAAAVLRAGFSRRALFHMILANARAFGEGGAEWTGYSYKVPGGRQGSFRELRVIGDKKAGRTTRQLRKFPGLLDRFRSVTGVPLRFVHVVRDPFDHVASRLRHKDGWTPEQVIDQLAFVYDAVASIKSRTSAEEVLDVSHEELIAEPRRELERCREFLGLAPDAAWLDAAANVVLPTPRGGRETIEWSPALRARLEAEIAKHAFLR